MDGPAARSWALTNSWRAQASARLFCPFARSNAYRALDLLDLLLERSVAFVGRVNDGADAHRFERPFDRLGSGNPDQRIAYRIDIVGSGDKRWRLNSRGYFDPGKLLHEIEVASIMHGEQIPWGRIRKPLFTECWTTLVRGEIVSVLQL